MGESKDRREDMISDDARVDLWRSQIEQIRLDLTDMNHHRDAMRRIVDVWNSNPRLLTHPGRTIVLDRWRMYFGFWLCVKLRRDTDRDKRSVSLLNIVSEVAEHAATVTDAQIRRLWNDPTGWYTRKTYPRFATPCGEHIDPAIPAADARQLATVSDSLRLFVNKALVHREQEPPVKAPTFDEIETIAHTYEEIAKRYILLLTGAAFRFEVVEQYDWIDIFDFAWRSPGTNYE